MVLLQKRDREREKKGIGANLNNASLLTSSKISNFLVVFLTSSIQGERKKTISETFYLGTATFQTRILYIISEPETH